MKFARLLFILTLLSGIAGTASAQRDPSLISSRHYVGLEIGLNDSWLGGASNFFWPYNYPYSDDPSNPVVEPLAFSSLGSGLGFHVGATLDLAFSDLLSLQGKLFYRQHSTGNTEQQTASCADVGGGNPGTADFESNYKLTLSYFGANLGLRIQFVPESFYGAVGLDFTSLSSNKFSGGESIVSSTNGCQFLFLPSGVQSGATSLTIPEQSTTNFFNSTQLHLRLAVGTFVKLGESDVVLTPEIALGIPLSNALSSDRVSEYKALLTPATPPSLWYASVSLGIKVPFGATSKEEEQERGGTETVSDGDHYTNLTGKVTDAATGDPVKANVTVVDLANNRVVTKTKTDGDGEYNVRVKSPGKYSVTADAPDYLFGSTYFQLDDQGRILKGNHDIKLSSSKNGRVRLLVFFDFGKDDLQVESYPELERAITIMRANPSMEVEIAGYTDNVGTDAFNMDLSLRRARSVRDYLIKNGISGSRITAKGYGKENPVVPNDTDDNRAQNRRVEFVVIKR